MRYSILVISFLFLSFISHGQDFTSSELNSFLKIEKIKGYNNISKFEKFLNNSLNEIDESELTLKGKIELENNKKLIQYSYSDIVGSNYTGFVIIDNEKNKIIEKKSFENSFVGASDGGTTYYSCKIELEYPLVIVNKKTKWRNSFDCNLLDFYNERTNTEVYYISSDYSFKLKYKSDFSENEYYLEKDIAKLKNYNKEELRKYRNYFFAKYNYKFKSSDLQEYFETNMREYKPLNENVDSLLSHWDKYMINYIKLLENQK